MQRNICPICGSENPADSEFCQVCKANLSALPKEIYPAESEDKNIPAPLENVEKPVENEEMDLDSPIPGWMISKLNTTEKRPMDFDAYTDMLFGMSDNRRAASPNKFSKAPKMKPEDRIYQPQIQGIVEPPLLEPDENSTKSIEEEIPGIADFRIQRPARKWEDRKPEAVSAEYKGTSISLLDDFKTQRPAKKWDDAPEANDKGLKKSAESQTVTQLPLWWQQDAPLVEMESGLDLPKTRDEEDDPALELCTSPTKVVDAAEIFRDTMTMPDGEDLQSSENNTPVSDVYVPENGSLVSDLMNEINRNSGTLSPAEQEQNRAGTLFYSGNHPSDEPAEEEKEDFSDIILPDDDNNSAEMLDRILRNIGYEVEGENQPADKHNESPESSEHDEDQHQETDKGSEPENAEEADRSKKTKLFHGFFIPQIIDNPLIPDDDEDESSSKDADPYDLLGESIPEKDDYGDDQDIPWDLFGTADMALPQSPEDQTYQTFSRGMLPEDPESTGYQQRMISSILGKILQAENYVSPNKEKNNRQISFSARIFWAALAIVGVVLLLQTNLADYFDLPAVPAEPESAAFYDRAAGATGDSLVVVDYTPAYDSEMGAASQALLDSLTARGRVSLAVLNPGAMPTAQKFRDRYGNNVEFLGWWPAGVLSLRSRMSSGVIPENVWLLTSESTSARVWAEQLSVSADDRSLYVVSPGQLEPLLKPYLQSSMITGMLSRDIDLKDYGNTVHSVTRDQMAVWFLCGLIPLAWLSGLILKFLKSEPDYRKRSKNTSGRAVVFPEEEPEKDQQNG